MVGFPVKAVIQGVYSWMERLERQGIQSHTLSPLLMEAACQVVTKDDNLRLYVNYRGLSAAVSKKSRYSLPLINDIMEHVGGSQWFSKIDIRDSYYRFLIKKETGITQHSATGMETLSAVLCS